MHSLTALRISIMVMCVFLGPVAARAEQLMKLPPEMRLLRGTTDQGEASYNATISKIPAESLPDAVLEDVKIHIINYAGDIKQLGNVQVLIWDAPYFRQQNLPSNYVIDFSAVQAPKGAVNPYPACDNEGCLVMGYTFAAKWKQDFELRSLKTTFNKTDQSDGNYQLEMRTLSNKENCETDGIQTKQGCLRRFTWRKYGLAVLPPTR